MKNTELRIGNFVNFEQTTHQITSISNSYCESVWTDSQKDNYTHLYKNIKPIPLTEEWLLKFGFEKAKRINNRYHLDPIQVYFNLLDNKFKIIVYYNGMQIYNIKYIHQLQNLYFALTQKELL